MFWGSLDIYPEVESLGHKEDPFLIFLRTLHTVFHSVCIPTNSVPYDFTYMWNLKNNINTQIKQKQTHRYREQIDGCQRGRGLGVWVKKVKGLRSTDWQLQNSHGDVKYSIGNTVSNSLIPMYGARWV